jgi:hypothetical protein
VYDGGGFNATPWPLYPTKEQVPITQEATWDPGVIRMGVEVTKVSYTLSKLDNNVKINIGKP